ncbi:DNA polymerase III subunit beta [Moraxella sp.]|uniref:DNA polymerase III subunit beta n=1 Tax=Moraxella sp. TaxID=479 RepID=UPI0026DD4290|nr:DNA polymerase III subunit beta [Moraxella sp.]MDO4894865.1 DNA polymerase III subunit beta [Moraxella sp.]
MKLVINRDLLIKAVNLVVKAADKRHRLAILANIKIELSPEFLVLTGSDIELELTVRLPISPDVCIEAGSTTLPAEMFFGICKSLSDEMVTIEAPQGSLRCQISSGQGKYTLSALPADDFPGVGAGVPTTIVKIAQSDLVDLIHRTRFAMATQDVRHYLTGVLFELGGEQLTAVATDGHRLAMAYRPLNETYEPTQMIIPGKAISELERLLLELSKSSNDEQVVELGFNGEYLQVALTLTNEEQVGVAAGMEVGLTARLIEGKFPDYRRVIPTENDKKVYFDRDAMADVLRRISILNSKEVPGVLLNFSSTDTLKIGVDDKRSKSQAEELLAVSYQGGPIELSFNESYLRAVLGVLEGKVCIEMSQPGSPTLIYQDGDEFYRHVIMPMRV